VQAEHEVQYDVARSLDAECHPDARLKYLEVEGKLCFCEKPLLLIINTIQVLPSGTLQIGTPEAPHISEVEIVFTDEPYAAFDTKQTGGGLHVFGKSVIVGRPIVNTFCRLDEMAADDWLPDDEVVIPDTRQVSSISNNYWTYKTQTEVTFLSNISSLQHPHTSPEGLSPHVGNLARSIILRSENPQGIRGHTQWFGDAYCDVRYTHFKDMGRTRSAPLNAANQVGRYSFHWHHVDGPMGGIEYQGASYQGLFIGNSVTGNLKWGITIHGSHYMLVQDNVVWNTDGAGIACEDGSEFGNLIDRNFVCGVYSTKASSDKPDRGDRGDGIWMAGPMSLASNNVVTDCTARAYAIWPDDVVTGLVNVPVSPGSTTKEQRNVRAETFRMGGNECYGPMLHGYEFSRRVGDRLNFPGESINTVTNAKLWNVLNGITLYYVDSILIDGWKQVGDPKTMFSTAGVPDEWDAVSGIKISAESTRYVKIVNADIRNMRIGILNRSRGSDLIEVDTAYLDNQRNVLVVPWTQKPGRDLVMTNVEFGKSSLWDVEMDFSPPGNFGYRLETTSVNGKRIYYHKQADRSISSPAAGEYAPDSAVDGASVKIKGLIVN